MASILKVNTIQDATNSNTALSVDSSGRVTTPARPAFCGTSSTQQGSGDYFFTTYTVTGTGHFNRGGHFNATTGVFTAPVDGAYHFGFIFRDTQNTTNRKIGRIYINGVEFSEIAESSDMYADIGGSITFELSANDEVRLATHPAGAYFQRVIFSGFLLG